MKLCSFIVFLILGCFSVLAEQNPSEIDLLFLKNIKPLLKVKCWGCHGEDPDKIKGKYIMLDRE
ncbi:MAG: hypothetical protein NE328_19680, partial [Lentisphaeraceae bacterium]|nr:hypothetical protein [Lentisphaeraceae bacterium]